MIEACVTSLEEAVGAEKDGAHRLELCRELETGGLTPPRELVRAVRSAVGIPVFAMARPRSGPFVLRPGEAEELLEDIAAMRRAGAQGIVVGALCPDGTVDLEVTRRCVEVAAPLPVTFHRAFDGTSDLEEALEAVAAAGVVRVLTGGGPGAAREHPEVLAGLVARAAGRLGILVGGRVRGDHVRRLLERTGAREVHARACAIAGIRRALEGAEP